MVGCCPISDLLGKRKLILAEAYAGRNIGFPLPNRSEIGQVVEQRTVLLFSPINVRTFNEDLSGAVSKLSNILTKLCGVLKPLKSMSSKYYTVMCHVGYRTGCLKKVSHL